MHSGSYRDLGSLKAGAKDRHRNVNNSETALSSSFTCSFINCLSLWIFRLLVSLLDLSIDSCATLLNGFFLCMLKKLPRLAALQANLYLLRDS
jgi:hypothetical protein